MRDHTWWKHLHWPEYGAELLGTAFLVFAGVSAVVFVFGTGSPLAQILPDTSTRRLIAGLLFAGCGALVAISPLGKLSGGHINPVVSLAFWMQGKMHHFDLGGYMLGQLLGAILGSLLLVLVWREHAASVGYGTTVPGAAYPLWIVFLAEVGLTFVLVLSIFLFVSSHRLMRWTPLMVWILVAVMVWLEAPISGTSLNPARSFGPALVSSLWQAHWLYWVAPSLGALLAVGAFRILAIGKRDVLTGKMFHVPHYRSVFMNVTAPCMPADGRLRKTT
ncbi:MAG: aquaporin family protein [Chloroflexi bacterium]|nr:MAG: aquaporin family protein [Chloroflexota bacterium]